MSMKRNGHATTFNAFRVFAVGRLSFGLRDLKCELHEAGFRGHMINLTEIRVARSQWPTGHSPL